MFEQHTIGDMLASGVKITADDVHYLGHHALIAVVHDKCAALPRGGATIWRVDRCNGKYIADYVIGNTGSYSYYNNLDYFMRCALDGKVLLLDGHCPRPTPHEVQTPSEPLSGLVKSGELRDCKKALWGSPNEGLVYGWAGYED